MRINRSHTRREEVEGKDCTFAPIISERSRLLAEKRGRSTPEGTLRLTSGAYGMACLIASRLRELVGVCDLVYGRITMQHLHWPAFLLMYTRVARGGDAPGVGGGLGGVGEPLPRGAASAAGDAGAAAGGVYAPGTFA